MVQKIGRGGNERGGEGKEEKEEEEEKEEDEEEDEEDEEEDKEDEEDEEEEEDEAKRREEGRGREGEGRGREGEGRGREGGGNLSKISSGKTLSKLRLKLNQNKAKSTKHAGRPADLIFWFNLNLFKIKINLKNDLEYFIFFK